jgi:hypothetical protein
VKEDLVYIARTNQDFTMIKIGHSKNPRKRISHLRAGQPHGLTLLATLPGGEDEERRLHARFARHRVPGTREWFRTEAEVRMWFAEMLHNGVATAHVPNNRMFR